MDLLVYWVGEKPAVPMTISVMWQDGTPVNLVGKSVSMRMLDTNNHEVNLDGSQTSVMNAANGKVQFSWPTDRSLFTAPGEYVFQLQVIAGTSVDFTSTQSILVKEFGN